MIFQNHVVLEYYRFYLLQIIIFSLNKHVDRDDYKNSFKYPEIRDDTVLVETAVD